MYKKQSIEIKKFIHFTLPWYFLTETTRKLILKSAVAKRFRGSKNEQKISFFVIISCKIPSTPCS